MQHVTRLSTLLQEYITNICSCGEITVTVIVTSCNDKEGVYNILINGIIKTDAALSWIINMEGLTEGLDRGTEGLDLGIAVLYLQEQTNILESKCDEQMTSTQSEIFAAVAIILIIIERMILTLLRLICPIR